MFIAFRSFQPNGWPGLARAVILHDNAHADLHLRREGVEGTDLVRLSDRSLALLVGVLTSALVAYALTGFPFVGDYSQGWDKGIRPDVIHEVAIAAEALDGNPYRPTDEILLEHGIRADGYDGVSPRPPAALLLQLPLLLIPSRQLGLVATAAILLLLMGIGVVSRQIAGLGWGDMVWVWPILFISLPVVTSISYGSVSDLAVVLCIVVAWKYQESPWAGLVVGLAAAWRLWPALLIPALWISGRKRSALLAVTAFLVLNAAGLMLPGVTLDGSINSLIRGSSDWINHNMNSSLALALYPYGVAAWAVTSAVSIIGLLLVWRDRGRAFAIGTLAAVIASPLAWPGYTLAALPVALRGLARGKVILVALAVSPAVLWFLIPSKWWGHSILVVLLLGLVTLVVHEGEDAEPGRPEGSLTPAGKR